jgi:hybrid cluster-associated redox disulfide protein
MRPILSPEITVEELLDRYPRLLQSFMDFDLLCVGCPAEAFHTLTDVAREYHLDLNQLLQRIYKVIEDDEASHELPTPKSDGRSSLKK